MTQSTRMLLAVGAALAWLAALVADWMTIFAAQIQMEGFGLPNEMQAPFGIPVSAHSGTVSLAGLSMDLWLVVAAGALGSLLAGYRALGKDRLPRPLPLALVGVATLFTASAWQAALDPSATIGPGIVAASVGAVAGSVLALLPGADAPGDAPRPAH